MVSRFDQQYEVFQNLCEALPPDEAVKGLERLGLDEQLIQQIRDRHERETIQIRELEDPHAVIDGNLQTWYTGPQPKDKCWPALVRLLKKGGWSDDLEIANLDDASTKIVSLLSHPKTKAFSTRGLVVGHVQSGKTTNFTAVMAKAADRGYKLFIVLAGIHNELRRQTQSRLVRQLVEQNPTLWSQLTDVDRDFVPTANAAAFFGRSNRTHVICVIKKNGPVLRKFVRWLSSVQEYLRDCPALIVDDEADQATTATKKINPLIQQILGQLPKSAYVGYTATPFANLLIDPSIRDLYPSDFVVSLPKPPGHYGTEVLFGRYALDGEDPEDVFDGYDMIRAVPDDDIASVRPLKRSEAPSFTPTITGSLRDAVQYFLLSTAARRFRGTGNRHSTMLLHTSVSTAVHESFRGPLKALLDELAAGCDDAALLDLMRGQWDEETARVPAEEFGEQKVPFDELLPHLPKVIHECRVIMDNSRSFERLDYDHESVVAIAVGGNTLSRGLTLEGLSVSYFVRSVSAYDTLLQMGRWFGYRHGYADLPRIWMTQELQDWFQHLATVETEMRRDIDLYMTEDKNPLNFAVRIRTHPALRVTAAAKMKDAVTAASAYGGQRVQTRYFRTDADWLRANQSAAWALVANAVARAASQDNRPDQGRYIFRDVPATDVLEFLRSYRFHDKSQECDSDLLARYIERRIRNAGSLRRWNIAIIGRPVGDEAENFTFAPGVTVRRVIRAKIAEEKEYADIKTLMSRKDAAIDLDGDIAAMNEEQIKRARREQAPDVGLLVLYPIDKVSAPVVSKRNGKRKSLNAEDHVIGVGLVFPLPDGKDDAVEWDYISADLSRVDQAKGDIEEDDFDAIEADL